MISGEGKPPDWDWIFAHLAASGFSPADIDELEYDQIAAQFKYFEQHAPTHIALEVVLKMFGVTKKNESEASDSTKPNGTTELTDAEFQELSGVFA